MRLHNNRLLIKGGFNFLTKVDKREIHPKKNKSKVKNTKNET